MKTLTRLFSIGVLAFIMSCNQGAETTPDNAAVPSDATAVGGGQENVKDDASQKDVVKVATVQKTTPHLLRH
ncbi:MAG TPA: hypothetical protein VN726_01250 [Hanamia sp.]|nr:hypothetical protein [Hanamia sp.]